MQRLMLYWLTAAVLILELCVPASAQRPALTEVIGGSGGRPFADAQPAGARAVEVRVWFGERVDAVQMIYALPDGRTVAGPRHGGGGGNPGSFRLERDERVVGISGRWGEGIDSIRIHTDKRDSTLFGGGGGDHDYHISIPRDSEAVGFAGRAGEFLDAIGLTYGPIFVPRRREMAPPMGAGRGQYSQTPLFGGGGGAMFADAEVPPGARIAEIHVWGDDRIDAIQLMYQLPNRRIVEGQRHGGRGGNEQVFRLGPDEYVTGISGRYGEGVDSLRIHTNRRTSQLFGGRGGGRDYRIDIPRGAEAIGFAGRAGEFLDAIGLAYRR